MEDAYVMQCGVKASFFSEASTAKVRERTRVIFGELVNCPSVIMVGSRDLIWWGSWR